MFENVNHENDEKNEKMGHHEKLWLDNFQGSEILFYRRYVDDTFCLFHSEHDAILFFACGKKCLFRVDPNSF